MLDPSDIQTLYRIRNTIYNPNSDTFLSKVLTKGSRGNYISNGQNSTTVGGCVAKLQDTKGLETYDDFYDAFGLDYNPPGFHPDTDEFLSVIRFKTQDTDALKVPFGGNTDADLRSIESALGLSRSELTKMDYPFLGGGITKSEKGLGKPEYLNKPNKYLNIDDGAAIYDVYKDGTEKLIAIFYEGEWIKI